MEKAHVEQSSKLSVVRVSLTGAIVLGVFYLLCWTGSFLPVGPVTHRHLELFANPPITGLSLAWGIIWSVIFGGFIRAFTESVYNALGRAGR